MNEQQPSPMPLVIISGLSGSGKSTALSVFEDMGFFTVDGLPLAFVQQMVEAMSKADTSRYNGLALGMDLRQRSFAAEAVQTLRSLSEAGMSLFILFLEAREDALLKRYATTRRPHPLEKEGYGLERSLELERERLEPLRVIADLVVDTSAFSIHNLRRVIQNKWKELSHAERRALKVHLITFGFKYGTPAEADMVFDLRFLPNPYFVPNLKALSGKDTPVAEYVLDNEPGKGFFLRLYEFLAYILEQFEREGRFRLTVAIGCTGGRHRSVAVGEALAKALRANGCDLTLEHRHFDLG
jgi:UPF0042 nucleotide-binding protein